MRVILGDPRGEPFRGTALLVQLELGCQHAVVDTPARYTRGILV